MQKHSNIHHSESLKGWIIIMDPLSCVNGAFEAGRALHGEGRALGLLWGWGLWWTDTVQCGGQTGAVPGPNHGAISRSWGTGLLSRGGARADGDCTDAQRVVAGRVLTDAQRGRVVPAPHGPRHAGDVGAALQRQATGDSRCARGHVCAASDDLAPQVSSA